MSALTITRWDISDEIAECLIIGYLRRRVQAMPGKIETTHLDPAITNNEERMLLPSIPKNTILTLGYSAQGKHL